MLHVEDEKTLKEAEGKGERGQAFKLVHFTIAPRELRRSSTRHFSPVFRILSNNVYSTPSSARCFLAFDVFVCAVESYGDPRSQKSMTQDLKKQWRVKKTVTWDARAAPRSLPTLMSLYVFPLMGSVAPSYTFLFSHIMSYSL